MISIAAPVIGKEETLAINGVLKSGHLVQGTVVNDLEDAFAKYCGSDYAVAVNSGTAAIHCALYALGLNLGDEIITTPFSFIATINPILFIGCNPKLVDIEPETFNLDASLVESAISKKTKAILPVHLYGQICDYEEIASIAKKYKLSVVEDACQAIGAEYQDKKAGSLSDIGCFSLYATKNIMSGEGGVITTSNAKYAKRMRQFRQHGMSGPYEYSDIGYNYRMTDLLAAIALEQLKKVDTFNSARQRNAQALTEGLLNIGGIKTPIARGDRTHVYHQYTIRITNDFPYSREEVVDRLKQQDIGSGIYYPKPLHFYQHIAKLGYRKGDFPNAEKAAKEALSLPVHPQVSESDIKKIIRVFQEMNNER